MFILRGEWEAQRFQKQITHDHWIIPIVLGEMKRQAMNHCHNESLSLKTGNAMFVLRSQGRA